MLETSIGQSAAILNSDFIAIAIVKDRHIVWANAALHRILGYQPEELVGQATRGIFLDQDSYEAFGREAYAALAVGETYAGTIPMQRRDSSMGWYEFNMSRLAGDSDLTVGTILDITESYQIRKKLIDSEARYRSVVEDQTELIVRFFPDGRFGFVNEVFCRLFGKSADQLLGHRWQPIVHRDDQSMIEARLRELTPDNPVVAIENRVIAANGEQRWVQFVNRGFFDAAGTLTETQSVGRDITTLKQTEANLRLSEETLQRAQAVGRIGSFSINNDTETFDITKESARLFDLDNDTVATFSEWFSRVHPDDQDKVESAWRAALQGAPYDMTYRIVVQGGIRWIRALAELQFDDLGQLKQAVGTVQDVSDLKQIESILRESDEQLEMALAGSGLVLWDWHIPARKVAAGKRWFELLGYTNAELGNDEADWMALIHPKDLESFQQSLAAHLQGETPGFESEHRLRHKDGHWVSVEARGKVTRRDTENAAVRMVGTLLDITQRRRLKDEGMDLLKRIEVLIRQNSSSLPVAAEAAKAADSLTKRQRQIIGMIAIGMTSAEIGKRLHLATPTVISHRRNLMAKLDLHTTAEVTRFAIDQGLLASK
jgi:PAS domain S-box-containing protein